MIPKYALRCRRSAGKASETEECPLKSLAYCVRVEGMVAEVSVAQEFRNEAGPVEAVYQFPCDEKAAVSSVFIRVGTRTVVADLMEKQEARDTYDDGVAAGSTSALVVQQYGGYHITVGHIPAGVCVVVNLKYVVELIPVSSREAQLVLPLTNMPHSEADEAPYAATITCATDDPNIAGMCSPSHDSDLTGPLRCAPDRDVVITVTAAVKAPMVVTCSTNDKAPDHVTHALAVPVRFMSPEKVTSSSTPNTEIVIFLDCSGSMSGSPIQSSERVAKYLVQSLPQDCCFNIVKFGSRFKSLFPKSTPLTAESLSRARKYLGGLQANLGGTDLYRPLKALYEETVAVGCSRQFLVLTDGAVSDTSRVLSLVKAQRKSTRVFSVGLGTGCSEELVDGLARMGNGAAAYVVDTKNITSRVMPIVQQMAHHSITGCSIKSTILGFSTVSDVIPPVFQDTVHVAYAFASSAWDPRTLTDTPPPQRVDFKTNEGTCAVEYRDGFLHLAVGSTSGRIATEKVVLRRGSGVVFPLMGDVVEVKPEGSTSELAGFLSRYSVGHNLNGELTVGGLEFSLYFDKGYMCLGTVIKVRVRAVESMKYVGGSLELTFGSGRHEVAVAEDDPHLSTLGDMANAALIPHNLPATNGAVINLVYNDTHGQQCVVPCVGGGGGHSYTHKMSAFNLIKQLEDEEVVGDSRKAEIVAVSLGCKVPSKYTSFVAVDEGSNEAVQVPMTAKAVTWESRSRRATQKLNACRKGLDLMMMEGKGGAKGGKGSCNERERDMDRRDRDGGGKKRKCSVKYFSVDQESRPTKAKKSKRCRRGASEDTPTQASPDGIIYMQAFDGSWALTEQLAAVLGVSVAKVKKDAAAHNMPHTVWATILVLRHLAQNYPDTRSEWEMIRKKALRFLSDAGFPDAV